MTYYVPKSRTWFFLLIYLCRHGNMFNTNKAIEYRIVTYIFSAISTNFVLTFKYQHYISIHLTKYKLRPKTIIISDDLHENCVSALTTGKLDLGPNFFVFATHFRPI